MIPDHCWLRLFGCASVRTIWNLLTDNRSRLSVEAAECYADALINKWDMMRTRRDSHRAYRAAQGQTNPYHHIYGIDAASQVANQALPIRSVLEKVLLAAGQESHEQKQRQQLSLLLCVFGNPFRPILIDVAHRTPTVVSVARAAYDERQLPSGNLDPHRLAVLADALVEAGAPDELVAHLRGPGPHVRGCHVVDLCLGLS
jgi:hypothetical protein